MPRHSTLFAVTAALAASVSLPAHAEMMFNRIASFAVADNLPADIEKTTPTSSEIITVSEDGMTLVYSDSPLGAYYFGAFRNNYVDDRPEKRYREMEAFPGFEIDEIAVRQFGRVTGEINLPPVRFAEVGTPSIYLSYIRPAAFAGAMATKSPDGSNHTYADVGAQLDLNFTVALRLPMILSVGTAAGFLDGDYRKTEWMVSLKIM